MVGSTPETSSSKERMSKPWEETFFLLTDFYSLPKGVTTRVVVGYTSGDVRFSGVTEESRCTTATESSRTNDRYEWNN